MLCCLKPVAQKWILKDWVVIGVLLMDIGTSGGLHVTQTKAAVTQLENPVLNTTG